MSKPNPNLLSRLAAGVCFAGLGFYLWGKESWLIRANEAALILFLAGVLCILLPFVESLKVGGFELKMKVSKIGETVLKGEVVRTKQGLLFFIDRDGDRYALPDDGGMTADFLSTGRGIIDEKGLEDEIEKTTHLPKPMESVLECTILNYKGHLFAILNGKRYHIPSWSFPFEWFRKDVNKITKLENTETTIDELLRYDRGR